MTRSEPRFHEGRYDGKYPQQWQAWHEGASARWKGFHLGSNPYRVTDLSREWSAGWSDVDQTIITEHSMHATAGMKVGDVNE